MATTTSTTILPPASQTELDAQAQAAQLAKLLDQIQTLQLAYQYPQLALSGGIPGLMLTPALQADLQQTLQDQTTQRQVSDLALANIRRYLEGGSLVSPAEETAINTMFANQRGESQTEIQRAMRTMGASRGLPLSSSPVANELARQLKSLEVNLDTAKTSALLALSEKKNAAAQVRQTTQASLDQAAATERFRLLTVDPLSARLAQNMMANRLGTATTSTVSPDPSAFQQAGGLGGLGAAMAGASTLYPIGKSIYETLSPGTPAGPMNAAARAAEQVWTTGQAATELASRGGAAASSGLSVPVNPIGAGAAAYQAGNTLANTLTGTGAGLATVGPAAGSIEALAAAKAALYGAGAAPGEIAPGASLVNAVQQAMNATAASGAGAGAGAGAGTLAASTPSIFAPGAANTLMTGVGPIAISSPASSAAAAAAGAAGGALAGTAPSIFAAGAPNVIMTASGPIAISAPAPSAAAGAGAGAGLGAGLGTAAAGAYPAIALMIAQWAGEKWGHGPKLPTTTDAFRNDQNLLAGTLNALPQLVDSLKTAPLDPSWSMQNVMRLSDRETPNETVIAALDALGYSEYTVPVKVAFMERQNRYDQEMARARGAYTTGYTPSIPFGEFGEGMSPVVQWLQAMRAGETADSPIAVDPTAYPGFTDPWVQYYARYLAENSQGG